MVSCDSQGVESKTSSASVPLAGLSRTGVNFDGPQRVLARTPSQLLNQSGGLRMGIWRRILNKEEENSREDREHRTKEGLFFSLWRKYLHMLLTYCWRLQTNYKKCKQIPTSCLTIYKYPTI